MRVCCGCHLQAQSIYRGTVLVQYLDREAEEGEIERACKSAEKRTGAERRSEGRLADEPLPCDQQEGAFDGRKQFKIASPQVKRTPN